MEGLTGWLWRRVHHELFGGADKYFTPFLSPNANHSFQAKERDEIEPAHNEGLPVVPQILTNSSEHFIWCARELHARGYGEVNLNLGCPSGTVTGKRKGSGLLAFPDELDRLLGEIFTALPELRISVKTRIGKLDPAEWEHLLAIYNRYPICELTIHPRVRQDFYKGRVRESDFAAALPRCVMPVCYNGDIVSERDAQEVSARYPALSAVMLGRGLLGDPSLVTRLTGGKRADKAQLQAFHDTLFARYCEAFGDSRIAMLRMKELWFYFENLFENSAKPAKAIKKAKNAAEYEKAAAALFSACDTRENVVPAWFRPA